MRWARDRMQRRQSTLCPRPDRGLASRDDVVPHTGDGVEEEKPRRGHQRLRLRQPGLRAPIFAKGLVRTFVPLRVRELDEGLDGSLRDAQSYRAETRMDARRIRELVSRI